MRLVCFPHAGGNASAYRSWAQILPADIGVCPVLLPGREERVMDPPLRSIAAIVDAALSGLLPYLDRPFALFGHSMGALVAFELARQLTARGGPRPQRLYVSGCEAPTHLLRKPPLAGLPTPALVAALARLGGTPPEALAHPELLELVLPMIRADFHASESYRFEPCAPLPISITAFAGRDDPDVEIARVADWQAHTQASFALHVVPGDHFFFTHDSVAVRLAAELSQERMGS